jgi:hypothetical protein
MEAQIRGTIHVQAKLGVVFDHTFWLIFMAQPSSQITAPPTVKLEVVPLARVIVFANVHVPESDTEILERDPKAAILFVRPIQLGFESLIPQWRLVSPVTLPLTVISWWVAEFD